MYIDTRTRQAVAAALGSPGLRAAVLELLSEDVRLILDANTACVSVAGALSDPPRARAPCCAAWPWCCTTWRRAPRSSACRRSPCRWPAGPAARTPPSPSTAGAPAPPGCG
ncbi:MAG: hypothetical protein M0C28_41075 [Candidatus Moduliflexus flocculans]|nr:hypothetical protein [Candidatus Moduliflexus flocculans]